MNNTFAKENIKDVKPDSIDWGLVQKEMKSKLGVDIYDSWLKKINFIEEFIETKVSTISTSPERKDTILIEDPFKV